MAHYVCEGTCRGISEVEGVCQSEDCPKNQQPLTSCGCEDGGHTTVWGNSTDGEQVSENTETTE